MSEWQSPFPTVGQIVKFIIDALDIRSLMPKNERKTADKYLERFANESGKDFDEYNDILQNLLSKAFNKLALDTTIQEVIIKNTEKLIIRYKKLVLETEIYGADRKTILSFLSGLFIYSYYEIYNELKNIKTGLIWPIASFWFLPDFDKSSNNKSYLKIINNFYPKETFNTFQLAKNLTRKDVYVKNTYKIIGEWQQGNKLPTFKSLNDLYSENIILLNSFKASMLLARFFDYSFKYLKKIMTENDALDLFSILNETSIALTEDKVIQELKSGIQSLSIDVDGDHELMDKFNFLYQNVGIKKQNTQDVDMKLKDICTSLYNDSNFKNHAIYYKVLWCTARFYLLLADFDKSINVYYEAFERAKYCAGPSTKEIIREAITLATYLKHHNKSKIYDFKSLYQWAHYSGLFEQKYSELDETAFIDSQRKQFFRIFKIESFYDSVPESIIKELRKEADRYTGIVYTPERKIDIDFNDPNKLVDGNYREISQLMHCITMQETANAIKLIEAGANINWLDSANGSALLYALQARNKEIVTAILNSNKKSKVLNTATNARILTPLMIAVEIFDEYGYLYELDEELVNLLLEKGADPNQKALIDDITPLDYLCNLFKFRISGIPALANADKLKLVKMVHSNQWLKRFTGALFDQEAIDSLLNLNGNPKVEEKWQSILVHIDKNKNSILKTIDLLKKNGAVGGVHLF